jgi:hypothetical protein
MHLIETTKHTAGHTSSGERGGVVGEAEAFHLSTGQVSVRGNGPQDLPVAVAQ